MFNPNKIYLYSLSFLKYAEDLNPKQKLISFIEEAMDLIDYSFVISRDINKEDKILKLKSIKEQATNIIKEAAKIAIQFENSKELKQQYGFTYSQRGGGYVDKVKEIAETIKSYILFFASNNK